MPDVWTALAKGAKVRLITRDGERDLSVAEALPVPVEPQPPTAEWQVACLAALQALAAETRATVTEMRETRLAIESLMGEQMREVKRVADYVGRPSVPVYDKSGKLIGVKRVDALE